MVADLAEVLPPVIFILARCYHRRVKSRLRLLLSKNIYCNRTNFHTRFNFVYFVLLAESTKFSSTRKPYTYTSVSDTTVAVRKFLAHESRQTLEYEIFTRTKISAITVFSIFADRVPLFRPMWASSVQCRHWSRHMAKASFMPYAWVANTCRTTSADTLPRQSAQTTCEQAMSFASGLKSVATPVQSAQQLGSQTDQVWRQIKPGWSYFLFFILPGFDTDDEGVPQNMWLPFWTLKRQCHDNRWFLAAILCGEK